MRAPEFWLRAPPSMLARILRPLGGLYGRATAHRMAREGARAQVPVFCVGNFTAGGAGKTPTALALAELLAASGERPYFLTRGYGGREAGPLVVDASRHTAAEIGDEPLLLARAAPTIVSRERIAGAALCARHGASLVVMDDGLQNPSLVKDLAIAVVDGEVGIGNGLCLPAGPLRAPMDAQLARVDALVVLGRGAAGEAVAQASEKAGKPVFRARLVPDPATAEALEGRRVLAFAGIGRPEKFFASLESCGATVVERVAFPDHHPFRPEQITALAARARAAGLVLVTTQKDRVRIGPLEGLVVLPVRAAFDDEAGLRALCAARLLARREGADQSSRP